MRRIFRLNPLRSLAMIAVLCLTLLLLWCTIAPAVKLKSQTAVFTEVWQTVNDNFYDPKFNGVEWQALRRKYELLAAKADSPAAVADVINAMLGELKTSHTRFYTQAEPAYYQLLGIFSGNTRLQQQAKALLPKGSIKYPGIGVFTRELTGKTFISAILDGSPAAKAGLKVGDQVLSVEGSPYEPIASFAGKVGQPVNLIVQRTANRTETIAVTPQELDPNTLFLDAMRASVDTLERQGKTLGYIHIWSYAGDRYQDQLVEELTFNRLREVDGLILDLRDGWGGASPSYLNIFTGKVPSMTQVGRSGVPVRFDYQWQKPVVMLVNQGSRSGKEVIAYGFQQYGLGKIVGTKTAGAVVGGRPFLMRDGSMLYLAVVDVFINGKQRLEGVGVVPDVEVPFTLEYAQGADPQKDKAVDVLLQELQVRIVD